MKTTLSGGPAGAALPNIAALIERQAARFGDRDAFCWKEGTAYRGISWTELQGTVVRVAANLQALGFGAGDKMVLFSPNRLEMLVLELAVMASGGIAVPLFAWFRHDTAGLLIRHSGARHLAVAGQYQMDQAGGMNDLETVIAFDAVRAGASGAAIPFGELLAAQDVRPLNTTLPADTICLNMYTSGTMGTPKCVQLTHENILSQRAALERLWPLDENDRFLSYLPWHHSFGGIFELFTALYHGATLSLESGYGKDPELLLENWKLVQPTVFFSVPRIYEDLLTLCKRDPANANAVFHPGLKFVFTAAAPLPAQVSAEFERRGIPVYEGWGLTETSPCCTLTDPSREREPGTVGFPIPGVNLRLGDENEIQVKGPNVMVGYYRNDEANAEAFTPDGWFRTGDIGEITESGLKLVARKDRIFKLSNGEKVIPSEMESLIQAKCHYVSYALVEGSGREYPVALLFPNRSLLESPDYSLSPMEGCFCPRTFEELGKCLQGCLQDANCGIRQKFAKIKSAAMIDDALRIDNNTLTPSMKIAPRNVASVYKAHLENMYGGAERIDEPVFVIRLESPDNASDNG